MGKGLRRVARVSAGLVLCAFVAFCGLVNLGNAPKKAERDRQARADATELVALLETFRREHGHYPASSEEATPRSMAERSARPRNTPLEYQQLEGGRRYRLEYFEAPMGALPSDGLYSYDPTTGNWSFELL